MGPNEALFSNALRAEDFSWFPFPALTEPMRVTVKIRHSQNEQPAMVYPEADGRIRVEFDAPQRAVTPGQAVVLYQGDLVIGGGTITEELNIYNKEEHKAPPFFYFFAGRYCFQSGL